MGSRPQQAAEPYPGLWSHLRLGPGSPAGSDPKKENIVADFTMVGKLHPDRDKDADYDVPAEIPGALHDTCSHLLHVVDQYHPASADLWPEVPSSLYNAFLQQQDLCLLVIVPTYDASTHGWGALIQSISSMIQPADGSLARLDSMDELIVGSHLPDFDISNQVFLEAAAGCLVTEAAIAVAKACGFNMLGLHHPGPQRRSLSTRGALEGEPVSGAARLHYAAEQASRC